MSLEPTMKLKTLLQSFVDEIAISLLKELIDKDLIEEFKVLIL